MGLHVTTARFHLERLVEAGVVTAGFHRHGTGRPHKRYAVAPEEAPTSGPADAYRMLAELLTEALAPRPRAGRSARRRRAHGGLTSTSAP